MRSRRRVIAIALAFATVSSLVLVVLSRRSSRQPNTIGVILPLTGDAAVYGNSLREGIELAHAQTARSNKGAAVLAFEDDHGKQSDAISALRKLLDVNRPALVIGGAMSSTAEAIIPVADAAPLILISPTATKTSLVDMSRYFFRLWPSDNYDGKFLARAAYIRLQYRRVAVLYINTAYGQGIKDIFVRDFCQLGGTIVSQDGYAQGEANFRSVITRIGEAKPDAVFIPGYVAEISQVLRQTREQNITLRFIGVNSMKDKALLDSAGVAAEDAVFSYPMYDAASGDPLTAEFVAAFVKKFNHEPDVFAAQGYDAYRVAYGALASIPSAERTADAIRRALLSAPEYEGPGGAIKFMSNGDVEKPLRLMTIRDGKFEDL